MSMRHSHLGKLGSKCRDHHILHRQPHPRPNSDQPESQGSSKPSACPQVQVFSQMKNYKYLLIKFILFSCNMKYETWASSMHWLWIVKYSNPSRLPSFPSSRPHSSPKPSSFAYLFHTRFSWFFSLTTWLSLPAEPGCSLLRFLCWLCLCIFKLTGP